MLWGRPHEAPVACGLSAGAARRLTLAGVLAAVLVAVLALWGVPFPLSRLAARGAGPRNRLRKASFETRAEQADVQNHLRQYQQMVAAGVGGWRAAPCGWRTCCILQQQDFKGQVSFTLAAPEAVELPQAAVAQARVQRHVLELQFARVHEIEVLRVLEQLRSRHALVSRVAGCVFEQPTPEGLSARCRVNFLHIDPLSGADQNPPK